MTHYAIMNVCCSFFSACTLDWEYGDEEATTDETEVTCEDCLKFLKEANEIDTDVINQLSKE